MKTKITKYFKLQREIDSLDKKEKELINAQDNIFMSKFKTNEKCFDGSAIFKIFLNNPDQAFDIYDLSSRAVMCWSKESLNRNMKYIIKTLLEEEFIIREERGFYGLNPEFVSTIKRNQKDKK